MLCGGLSKRSWGSAGNFRAGPLNYDSFACQGSRQPQALAPEHLASKSVWPGVDLKSLGALVTRMYGWLSEF